MRLSPNAACKAFAGSAMSSAYCARPLTCRCALSWRSGSPIGGTRSDIAHPRWQPSAAVLEVKATQQVGGHLETVGTTGAQIAERLEVRGQLECGGLQRLAIPGPAGQCLLGGARAARHGCHAAESD